LDDYRCTFVAEGIFIEDVDLTFTTNCKTPDSRLVQDPRVAVLKVRIKPHKAHLHRIDDIDLTIRSNRELIVGGVLSRTAAATANGLQVLPVFIKHQQRLIQGGDDKSAIGEPVHLLDI